MTKLLPGVVTGQDYRTLVSACKDGGYALAAVNVTSSSTINAVLEAAAKNKSDVIIQLSNGGAEFMAGRGFHDSFRARVLGAVAAAQHVHLLAAQYGVCVALHTDHANRKLLPWIDAIIQHSEGYFEATKKTLFSSHMLDLSEEPLADNIATCARYLERLAKIDMSLEVEVGVTGGEEDGVGSDHTDSARLYSSPQDVAAMADALASIGHFSVAAAFGNVHGVYAPGNVELRPGILGDIQAYVAQKAGAQIRNPLHFVFHGGSGSDVSDIRTAITHGVFKMNIDTDTQFAYAKGAGDYITAHARAFHHQIDPETGTPYKKEYDPRAFMRAAEEGMVARLESAFDVLGSRGRSLAGL
jgi:fructose-bisphosphate aldolase class II